MRGILMTPDNARAIEENRKTQTRRLGGLKEINEVPDKWRRIENIVEGKYVTFAGDGHLGLKMVKPQYQVGDVVYIKEAWSPCIVPMSAEAIHFKMGGWKHNQDDWHSPMFLKAANARYFIKILDVRPERLQEITEEDAIAEGIIKSERTGRYLPGNCDYAVWAYGILWDSINPKHPWATNPWIWRYELGKVNKEVI